MNILLVSQCSKNALAETRRILDQFAERRGERTWQTPITQQGLDTLYRLLRKTARKNTAVACHWIRGKNHRELLWIVGDARQFNERGATPTNSTRRDVLRGEDENDWHALQDIYLLTALAALLHDLGKSCQAFQARLKPSAPPGHNQIRHEWISVRLFQAFVGTDDDGAWLARLRDPSTQDDQAWTASPGFLRDGLDAPCPPPLAALPPLARAVAWLMLTHHRLPQMPAKDLDTGAPLNLGVKCPDFRPTRLEDLLSRIEADWNELRRSDEPAILTPYWHFPHGLPVTTPRWRKNAARIARQLQARQAPPTTPRDWLDNPYVMHLARLSLMLADHHYSSLVDPRLRESGEAAYPLYANTVRKTGQLNQPLDEHLQGVFRHAGLVCRALPGFERALPRLLRHKALRKRSGLPRFRWQDKAADMAGAMGERAAQQGAFIINLASTGCGKTLANARIMNALSDPSLGLRCAFALGLRTLTLQTGRAFRDLLGLNDHTLAVRVGGAGNRELHEYFEKEAERSGSASIQTLLPEDGHVYFDGDDHHPLLERAFRDPQVRALLAAPLLVCTVDHLVPATESARGGHQIAPMLRLLSGDLVLDELDDYDLADLPALTRLVYWAGLLGSRVLLSSATLPPALVQGMFEAYRAGRQQFQRNRGEAPQRPVNICCLWVDEFHQSGQDCAEAADFAMAHQAFARQRHACLAGEPVRRRARIEALPLAGEDRAALRAGFAAQVQRHALALHAEHHSADPQTGRRVSFGLVRMANIEPLVEVARALYRLGAPEGIRLHLCVYHARYPLLLRSAIEHRLDRALDRRQPDAVFSLPDIRAALDSGPARDHLFIVLGSPVTEVGRDHDYDWAIVEPSSVRSLIQLAGRVRRHRIASCDSANMVIFEQNLKCLEPPGKAAYLRPGFEQENGPFRLATHNLRELDARGELAVIDARPRLLSRPEAELQPQTNLIDLEHARLTDVMLPKAVVAAPQSARERRKGRAAGSVTCLNAASAWQLPLVHLTAVLPQQQPFREQSGQDVDLVLLPDEENGDYILHRVDGRREEIYVAIEGNQNIREPDSVVTGTGIQPWCHGGYMTELLALAEALDLPPRLCALRYGRVTVRSNDQGWRFHPALGFVNAR
ncbi:MAG: type I-F CRISPR-associated helicase Cas3f [Giesbergeria sp.]|jgi:CRISPR-associated endonuclease/helicase Cas3|nr:type I-F CRISPR-associated helicase Cas3f [Giesbergeria sp.]